MKRLPTPTYHPKEPSAEELDLIDLWKDKLETMQVEEILLWVFTHFHSKVAMATCCDVADTALSLLFAKMAIRINVMDRMERFLLPETWRTLEPHEAESDIFDGTKASSALWERFTIEQLCKKNEWKFFYYKIWIIGVLREQDARFSELPILSWNDRFGVIRVAPFAAWKQTRIEEQFGTHPILFDSRNLSGTGSVVPDATPANTPEDGKSKSHRS